MAAAAVTALLYQPLRGWLSGLAARLAGPKRDSPGEVLRTLGSRLTSALPLDELLLQLAESLRKTLALEAAEVWTGSGGLLERSASDPEVGRASLILTPSEEAVVARAGAPGSAWLRMWLPGLLAGREEAGLRAAPITHSGELLGLIVVERPPDVPFSEEEEQVLAALARQVGLALHNVRLGSALEASLDELQMQADELRASRARVVAAGDASDAGSSATSMTERSNTWSRSRSTSGWRASSPSPIRSGRGPCSSSSPATCTRRSSRSATSRTGSTHNCSWIAASPRPARRGGPRAPARPGRDRPDRPLPTGGRGDRLLLLPRGPPEHRQARGPDARATIACGRSRRAAVRGRRRRLWLRPAQPTRAAGPHQHERPARRARRSPVGRLGPGDGTRVAGAVPLHG